jgi:hypothetical protein
MNRTRCPEFIREFDLWGMAVRLGESLLFFDGIDEVDESLCTDDPNCSVRMSSRASHRKSDTSSWLSRDVSATSQS